MVTRWTVGDLDNDALFEVINSRDIDTANRFVWPIPSLLGPDGEPLVAHNSIAPKVRNGQVVIDKETGRKDYRFIFHNHKDNKSQDVKIDGTGCILFMSPSHEKAMKIKEIIGAHNVYGDDVDASVIESALEDIYLATGIGDRWHSSLSEIDKKYDPTEDVENEHFGRFVYKPFISAALYLGGEGIFEGDVEGGQSFHRGAFVIFPQKSSKETRQIINNFDALDIKKTSGGGKLIAYDVFLDTRRLPDGTPVVPNTLKRQDTPRTRYHKVTSIPGFPDHPSDALALEKEWLEKIERVYSSFGFTPIKTRTVEELSVLRLEEGETENESQVFEVKPLFEKASNPIRLGLRFDHTVPLARYIAENKGIAGAITFPFKSSRIGPVYRSQDVSRGKAREFIQADIDIVGIGSIAAEYDIEIPQVMNDLANELNLGDLEISISNRKIVQGFFESLGMDTEKTEKIIRLISHRDTLGIDGMRAQMFEKHKLDKDIAEKCLSFARIKTQDSSFAEMLLALCPDNDLVAHGIEELKAVMDGLKEAGQTNVFANMSVVRGMDYYTGTIYEARSSINPKYPPIMVGGRYDNMVGHFMKDNHPGVGFSFEMTTAMNMVMSQRDDLRAKTENSHVLVAYRDGQALKHAEKYAKEIRAKGYNVEIAYGQDHPKQMQYADRKLIPYVLDVYSDGKYEVRNMTLPKDHPTKVEKVKLETWRPII